MCGVWSSGPITQDIAPLASHVVPSYLWEKGVLSICSLPFSMSVQALRKVEEQRRTVIWNYKEPSVLVLDYFKIRGSPVLVLWQHIRMNELLVLVISKTLKDQWFLWKKWQSTDGFYERISNELMVFYERIGNELMDLWLVGQVLGALPNIMWNSIVACTLTYQYSALQKGQ